MGKDENFSFFREKKKKKTIKIFRKESKRKYEQFNR